MPLSSDVGIVAGETQRLSPQRREVAFRTRSVGLGAKSREARQQHHAAGDANCSRPASLLEAVGERTAILHQAIEVGSGDLLIEQRADAPIGQVVSNHEQEIGACAGGW